MGLEGVKDTLFQALSDSANNPNFQGVSTLTRGRNANLGYSVALGGCWQRYLGCRGTTSQAKEGST
jgi:hypothetical protein